MYLPGSSLKVVWEPRHLLSAHLSSVFMYYLCLLFGVSKNDQTDFWSIEASEVLLFRLISFVESAREGVFVLTTASLGVIADGFGVFLPMPDISDGWITNLYFFLVTKRTGLTLL